MPIPRGFVEVHPLERPPFLKPDMLRNGAVVKYMQTREAVGSAEQTEFESVGGFVARVGTAQVVHEFISRGGQGLPFKIAGDPALNARLYAIKDRWVIWLQWVAAQSWDVGAAHDFVRLHELREVMRSADDDLDRAILDAGGAFSGGASMIGIDDIAAFSDPSALTDRQRREIERRKAAQESQRARALMKELLAIGAPPVADVRHAFKKHGFSLEQLQETAEELAVEVVLTRRDKTRKLRLPTTSGFMSARVIAKTNKRVRQHIDADASEEAIRDRDAGIALGNVAADDGPVDRSERAARAAEARKLLRSLLKSGARPREFIQEQMTAAGFSPRQVIRAREAIGAKARRRGLKGRQGGGVWLLELPGTVGTVTRADDIVNDGDLGLPPIGWLRDQLAIGPRRLADVRREMPAPSDSDQVARDKMFLELAREAHVVVRRLGKRGFYIELAQETVKRDPSLIDAVEAAMRREGSPHIRYPQPKAWY